jgi:hypothetical protein
LVKSHLACEISAIPRIHPFRAFHGMPWINVFRLFFILLAGIVLPQSSGVTIQAVQNKIVRNFAICGVFLDFLDPLVYVKGEKGFV